MAWALGLLIALNVLGLAMQYLTWVVLCDLANQDRAARTMDDMANIFAEHLKES